ncbi:MAG: hypothetical protein ACE5FT_04265 [Candidatus Nanoarchaeia archaeon]
MNTIKFQLEHVEPLPNSSSHELAKAVLSRFGLVPRKKDGTAKFERLLLELYERKKTANKEHKPEAAVMPVEDMGIFSGIARQTMYEYLKRWVGLGILKKTSFVANGKVIIGYELNGNNLEGAFSKASTIIRNHTDASMEIIKNLQLEIKKEKLRSKESTT